MSSPTEQLLVRREGAVLVLSLNRPQARNALDADLANGLLRVLVEASVDAGVRAIVLTGEGTAFCAGDDLSGGADGPDARDLPFLRPTYDLTYLRIAEAMVTCPKPVIVALNGSAAGAGTELACAADLRVASTEAKVGSRILPLAQAGTLAMLGRVVGPHRATEIYLTNRFVGAEEALAIGLVDRVAAPEELMTTTLALAEELAALPTKAIGIFKDARERMWGQPVEYRLRLQSATHVRCNVEVEDTVEGLRAFLERRAPAFEGR